MQHCACAWCSPNEGAGRCTIGDPSTEICNGNPRIIKSFLTKKIGTFVNIASDSKYCKGARAIEKVLFLPLTVAFGLVILFELFRLVRVLVRRIMSRYRGVAPPSIPDNQPEDHLSTTPLLPKRDKVEIDYLYFV